jgi:60 kDa SS-A/Ro ribonucleoprotein
MTNRDPLKGFGTRVPTPQRERSRPDQVKNNAGGYVFQVSPEQALLRFLILGTTGGTYYVSERKLTKDNVEALIPALEADPNLVDLIRDVSVNGRAPKQNETLFALAAASASANPDTRARALSYVSDICRTGTMLFQFNGYAEQFRGRGQALNRAVRKWYTEQDIDKVAFQAVKYRQREGWTHRDLLRLVKPKTNDPARDALFGWLTGKMDDESLEMLPSMVRLFEAAQAATTAREWVTLIHENPRMPWELLPTQALAEPSVWEALLPGMPLMALVRNLGRLTRIGVIKPFSQGTKETVSKLQGDVAAARIHPINVMTAWFTYKQGHGVRGGDSWTPVPQVIEALEGAFYAAFGNVEPAGKRTLVSMDVSGSMSMETSRIRDLPLYARDAAAAMAMVTVRAEPQYLVTAFSRGLTVMDITDKSSLDEVVRKTHNMPFERTDCAQPMLFAAQNDLDVDTFMILTDNETWAGAIHPHQALERYRQKSGINARMVVVGMTATQFTIADPKDPGQMDVVGFDTATPNIISSFSRGDF